MPQMHTKLDVIDEAALATDITQLVKSAQADKTIDMRAVLLSHLKQVLHEGRREAEEQLKLNSNGLLCARRLSRLMDIIISQLYNLVVHHIFPQHNPSNGERIALIAVGGYGRGAMAPGSDIDLLFLLPWKQTPWGEQVMEFILYMLWDMGLKVGHATRNIDESIRMAKEDMTVRTALLETRFLIGNQLLYDELSKRFESEIIPGTASEFIRAKLIERDERHHKSGKTRYLVEPNVKEGKGGQRDLQTLLWITKYYYRIKSIDELVPLGVLSKAELNTFKKADNFLWAVRCQMHFLAGKALERLSFDIQRDIAHRLGYTAHPGMEDVERFMKHYFLVAKHVGDLNRIVCADLEENYAKSAPGLHHISSKAKRQQKKIPGNHDFFIDNARININSDDVFKHDPVNLIRLFYFADKYNLEYHPHAVQEASRSLRFITPEIRENPQANALFLSLLTSTKNPAKNLIHMNESGVLGKFIPQFGKIVAMMQFNMYHHYTVDEHLIRCIAYLSDIEHGVFAKDHPLTASLLPLSPRERVILYVATFLHDIAKGRPEDHSIVGERIARKLAPRFGLSFSECETVAWLIREHLTMSMVAQSRDLNDRKTINDFAAVVQTMDRLKLLLILTICDISGVGPGVWNGWKGQLLRTLYYETEIILTGGFSKISRTERIDGAKERLATALNDWDKEKATAYLDLHQANYWLTTPLDDQLRHAYFIQDADNENKRLAIQHRLRDFEAITEITVLAPDHPRLLSIIAGACAAAGGNIVDAQIFTTTDGRALDTILINREFPHDDDENRRAARVMKTIEEALDGKIRLPDIIAAQRMKPKRATKAFHVPPRIEINNSLSQKFSVIEVKGMDKPGLLSELTGAISDLRLDIASAHITTFGEKVIDNFYVTDLDGHKIISPHQKSAIKRKILPLLKGDNER